MQTHFKRKRDLGDFVEKMKITVQSVVWTVSPTGGKSEKTPIGRIPGGGNRGPGRPGLLMVPICSKKRLRVGLFFPLTYLDE